MAAYYTCVPMVCKVDVPSGPVLILRRTALRIDAATNRSR